MLKINKFTLLWISILSIYGLLFIYSYYNFEPAEDAIILYEYAKNLYSKKIITYSLNNFPIEGATDFLWMILLAFFKFFSLNEFTTSLLINFVSLLVLIKFFNKFSIQLVVSIVILLTPFLYSALSGFGSLFFTTIYIACLYCIFQSSRLIYLLILLLCLVRPDGVIFGLGCLFTRYFFYLNYRNLSIKKIEIINFLLYLFIPGICYLIWRIWYFGEYLPLPFYVKSGHPKNLWIFYKDSLQEVVTIILPFILVMILMPNKKLTFLKFTSIFFVPLIFYSLFVLEQNVGNRFMSPIFFGALFFINLELKNQKKLLAICLISIMTVILQFTNTKGVIEYLIDSRSDNVIGLSRELSQINGKMLVTESGRLAFYSNWMVDDSWGLNTPRFAHKSIREKDILDGKYDLIAAHCPLDYLSEDLSHTYEMYRSWDVQCRILINYIKDNSYIVYLIPYNKIHSNNQCSRHDIYAINPNFFNREKIEIILKKYGGFVFFNQLAIKNEDRICR